MRRLFSCILVGILCVSMAGCSSGNRPSQQQVTTTPAKSSESVTDTVKAEYSDFIFVGDSRFVGMKNAIKGRINSDAEFVAKISEGLAWLKKVAPDLYKNTGKTIVFNFGVNDLHNASKYVEFYNSMPRDFMENNTLVFMTVNPVDETKEAEFGFKVKNKDIEKFNNTMKEGLDEQYFNIIDTNTYVQQNGYMTTDGLHYYNDTYRLIFKYAVKCCEEKDFVRR